MALSCSIFLTLLFSHYFVGIHGDNIGTDQLALLALKSRGSSDSMFKNWSAESSVCSWMGVVCGSVSQRVISLDVSHKGLNGSIPPELGTLSFLRLVDLRGNSFSGAITPSIFSSLSNLQFLYLSDNRLSGSIPASVSNMSKLEVLLLRGNSLQGSIPPEMGHLRFLRVLDLQTNQLTGPLPPTIFNLSLLEVMALSENMLNGSLPQGPAFNLPMLQELYLFQNEFDGPIPQSLGKCSQLKTAFLSYNSFTQAIPRELGNLTQLDRLHISANKFTGFIPAEIGNLQALQVFSAHENFLSGSIPESLFNISTLRFIQCASNDLSGNLPPNISQGIQELNFAFNDLGGNIPDTISTASRLTTLCLSYNSLTGFIPETLGNLRSLEILCLSGNNLKTRSSSSELSIITSLTNCRNLRVLTIGGNPLNSVLPTSVGNLSTNIRTFHVGRSKLSGVIPEEIGNLTSVLRINLYDNELSGSIPTTVGQLKSLQELYLQNSSIEGSVPDTICSLGNLGLIDLKNNKISGPVPSCIGNITSLRYLYLNSNNFSSSLPPSLWTLKDLLMLSAPSNSLSGYIPPEIGSLRVVTYIDLSMNRLAGNIPATLGRLQSLITLSLAQNSLDGSIPDSFGRLVSLEMLDLSHNKLSGTIPQSLETIVYLKGFNISFNGLSGKIPTGGPFHNFTALSFISNAALCGASQFEVPPCPMSIIKSRARFRFILYTFIAIFSTIIILTYSAFLFMRSRLKKRDETEKTVSSSLNQDVISYLELQKITNGFSEGNLLAVGSESSVYEGILTDGTHAAIKVFNLKLGRSLETFDTECQLLSNLRHRNLTVFITSRATRDLELGALVMEYMPNGTLDRWLYSHNYSLGILQRLDVMIDVASALDYLHHDYYYPVVHCDVKPSNILLDEDMVAHLGDFGISKILGARDEVVHTKTIGTVGYIAPEYGSEGVVSTKCDVYSYGMMLMETFSRRRPSDDMFNGDITMKSWIRDSFPDAILKVADSNLLEDGENSDAKLQCMSSVMKLALHCTETSPTARVDIRTALSVLQNLRHELILMSCGKVLQK